MSKKKLVFRAFVAAVALAGAAFQGAHAATDTQNITVTASIAPLCKLALSSATLDFSGLDVTSAADAVPLSGITASYQCTKNTTVAATGFTVGNSSSGSYAGTLASTTTTDTIPFSISWLQPTTTFTGAGFATTAAKVSVALSGKILNADYVNKTPASYSATVPVVVNY